MRRVAIVALSTMTACARPSLLRVPLPSGSTIIETDRTVEKAYECIEALPKQDLAPLDASALIEMQRSKSGITLGTGGISVGPALGYCWADSRKRPLLFAAFRISVEKSHGGTRLQVTPYRSVVLRKKGWFAALGSRYQFEEIPVEAELEASLIAASISRCLGAPVAEPEIPPDRCAEAQTGRPVPG